MTLKLTGCVCVWRTERPEWFDTDDVSTTLTASTNQTEVVQLTCRVRGTPAPSVTWSKADEVIASDDIYQVVDKLEYRSDLYTWLVTSLLLLQGMIDWARFTSHQTHYRSYWGRFLRVIWPNQQC